MRAKERLERLDELLEELSVDNANTPILVEGMRDREALQRLGCRGQILLVNDGDPLLATADRLGARHQRIIMLPDWDRTGGTINRRMKEMLEAHGVTCDGSYRRQLAQLATKGTRTVEGLPAFLRDLRARLGRPPRL